MSAKRKVGEIDNDSSITLPEVIAEDQEMEETVDAVLGGSDDQECTYPKGYVKRQALYACYTCCAPNAPPAGVCLACCLECHNGHDLYELYTKRNFRCDCGNEKFSALKCKLFSDKVSINEKNVYNQNFRGLYCTCSRPYPDDEDDLEDEMIQCVVCEDWFHSRHLGDNAPPPSMGFSEMICFECTNRCPFLLKYNALLVSPIKLEKDFNSGDVDVEKISDSDNDVDARHSELVKTEENVNDSVAGVSCKIEGAIPVKINSATFWPSGWRAVLCKCQACLKMYEELKVTFLLDETDTVSSYEEEGKKKALEKKSSEEQSVFSGMSRFLQVEMLSGYKDMKEAFYDYFKKFADEGKVVTEADIRCFFNNLKNKRQKVDMPYSCR